MYEEVLILPHFMENGKNVLVLEMLSNVPVHSLKGQVEVEHVTHVALILAAHFHYLVA